MKTTLFMLLALAGSPAMAQEDCITDTVDCTTVPDDPICVTQARLGLPQTGSCDKKTAGALIGERFERYYRYKGSFPSYAEQVAFGICSKTGPAKRDGKCGWYRFNRAPEAAKPGDPIQMIADQLAGNAASTEAAYATARAAEQTEVDYECQVNGVLGLPCLKLLVFGPAAGGTNAGGFVGGMVAFHAPIGPYKSGLEFGIQAGYSGSQLDPGKELALGAQIGPFVQGVIMPWRSLGFVLGAELNWRLPLDEGQASAPDFLGARFGLRVYPARSFAIEALGLSGGMTDEVGNWHGAGGGQMGILLHL